MKKSETFNFGPWTVTSVKGTILKADTLERYSFIIKTYLVLYPASDLACPDISIKTNIFTLCFLCPHQRMQVSLGFDC